MGEDDYSWLMGDDGLTDPYVDPNITDNGDPFTGGGGNNSSQVVRPTDPFSGGGGTGGGGSGGMDMGGLLRALGIGGKGGNIDPLALLSMLGLIGGGIMSNRAIGNATNQVTAGLDKASDEARNLLGPARDNFNPYIDLGKQGASQLAGMQWQPLAGRYKPIGTGSWMAQPQQPPASGNTLGSLLRGKS